MRTHQVAFQLCAALGSCSPHGGLEAPSFQLLSARLSTVAAMALFPAADPEMAAPAVQGTGTIPSMPSRAAVGNHLKSSSVRMMQKKVLSLGSLANRSSTYASQEWWSISDSIDTEPAAEHDHFTDCLSACVGSGKLTRFCCPSSILWAAALTLSLQQSKALLQATFEVLQSSR